MSSNHRKNTSRREFLKQAGRCTAVSALAGAVIPRGHAAEDNTIRLALIGCGSRGNGAVGDAFSVAEGPIKLVAMADLFPDRLQSSYKVLTKNFGDKIDVPQERQFIGFDAYKKAIDCLKPGDVAMLCGYSAFRPSQLEYAVERGINVFMEKTFAPDVPGLRRVIRAGEAAEQKNLKIAAGLMCRHSKNRQELIRRIREGELGEILLVRACRMEGWGPLPPRPQSEKELSWQIRNFPRFFWVSGGAFPELNIHQVDEICWIKDAWPTAAHGVGGRAVDSKDCSQNLDAYAVEWTFSDGTRASFTARYLPECYNEFATYIHGSRCAAQFSGAVHAATVQIFKDQRYNSENVVWKAPKETLNPWQAEWKDLLDAIRHDRPHNEAKRAALANLATIMGRAAVHTGKIIRWEEALASDFRFCPYIDEMTADSPPPILPDERGRYPVPVPGIWKEL